MIKEYFLNYEAMNNDFTVSPRASSARDQLSRRRTTRRTGTVTLADTGAEHDDRRPRASACSTYVDGDTFMVTYGDGAQRRRHRRRCSRSTVATASSRPSPRSGPSRASACIEVGGEGGVQRFREKPQSRRLGQRRLLRLRAARSSTTSTATDCMLEQEPLERLAARRPADGLPPRRLLARRWTRTASRSPQRPVGLGRRAVGRLAAADAESACGTMKPTRTAPFVAVPPETPARRAEPGIDPEPARHTAGHARASAAGARCARRP